LCANVPVSDRDNTLLTFPGSVYLPFPDVGDAHRKLRPCVFRFVILFVSCMFCILLYSVIYYYICHSLFFAHFVIIYVAGFQSIYNFPSNFDVWHIYRLFCSVARCLLMLSGQGNASITFSDSVCLPFADVGGPQGKPKWNQHTLCVSFCCFVCTKYVLH